MDKIPLIVLDFETTGIKAGEDEVLQVGIIDHEYNTLFNTYCRPIRHSSWPQAEAVHGISPAKVKDWPAFIEFVPFMRELVARTQYIMAYNANFEKLFLLSYGIIPTCPIIDPMLMFSEYYGEIGRYGSYKWQKLTTCAEAFNYTFDAHDALADVKATLHCFNEMRKLGIKPKYI